VSTEFRRTLFARWGDMDFNGHMRNTAYLDVGADIRLLYFSEQGFPAAELSKRGIGPVILRDEVEYIRELRLHQPFDVNLLAAGLSPDGTRFRLQSEFFRDDGRLAARVVSTGGWLDLAARRLTPPPAELHRALAALQRTEPFAELEGR
jgi:acyl-CoA thioester hydrolase